MRVLLTKLDDRRHVLAIERAGRATERMELETRSTLYHDLTHFGVESAAGLERGFFGSLAAGKTLAELAGKVEDHPAHYTGEMLEIERTVAVLQRLAKSDEDPIALHEQITSMLDLQNESPPRWFTPELATEVRQRLRSLVGRWRATPYGKTMALEWPNAPASRAERPR